MRDKKPRATAQSTAGAQQQAPTPPKTALVRSPDGRPYWERHPEHPGGEVWVAGHANEPGKPVRVALTEGVKRALREERLERVETPGEAGDGAKVA